MLTRKKKIITALGIAAGLLVVALLVFWFFFRDGATPFQDQGSDTAALQQGNIGQQGVPQFELPPDATTVPASNTDPDANYAQQFASIFVERFSSFSNQNNNTHLEEVFAMATARMQTWMQTQRVEQQDLYQGKTVRVIATTVDAFSPEQESIGIQAQVEDTSSAGSVVTYRNGRVELVRSGNDWLVDGFFWQ